MAWPRRGASPAPLNVWWLFPNGRWSQFSGSGLAKAEFVRSSPVARSGGFVIDAVGPTRGQAGAEHLGQHRTKDRRGEHQHEDRIEHVTVEQALAAGVERVVGNQRRGECAATCGSVNDQTVSVASRV